MCTDASKELNYIKKVEGLLLQVWKFYENSPKKTATSAAVHSGLLNPLPKDQLSKAKKAAASPWLSFDESFRAMVQEVTADVGVV